MKKARIIAVMAAFGSFYLKELSTDEHYILSDEKHPIVFDYAGQETALVEIKATDGKPIDNDLIYGEIHGLKKDEDGNALGGAVIGLFKTDCTEFTRENAILTAVSREDGGFSFADVPYGNWLVREIKAPTGFVLSDETFAVTVDKDGAIIEVEIENTLIRGTVQLTKVDKGYDDWKADLEEQYPELSEDERISLMYELNGDYLDDERHNLDIQLSRPILVVGDLWLWNGCRMGYKEIESGNIRDCLYNERDIDYSTKLNISA